MNEPCSVCEWAKWLAWREHLVLKGGESPKIARMFDDCRAKAPKP
jgi:hypothetical protein